MYVDLNLTNMSGCHDTALNALFVQTPTFKRSNKQFLWAFFTVNIRLKFPQSIQHIIILLEKFKRALHIEIIHDHQTKTNTWNDSMR